MEVEKPKIISGKNPAKRRHAKMEHSPRDKMDRRSH